VTNWRKKTNAVGRMLSFVMKPQQVIN